MFPLPLQIHQATLKDQAWVNEQYTSIKFRLADLNHDYLAIASWEKEPAGLGRLQPVGTNTWELGGMYVFEDFRKRGIAGRLIQHLLQQVPAGAMVYCLPFQHLIHFYENHGFEKVEEAQLENIPKKVREKLTWCNASYPDPVILLGQKIE